MDACKWGSTHSKHLLPGVKMQSHLWKRGSHIAVNKQKPKPKNKTPNPHQNAFSQFFIISDILVEINKKNANKQNLMRQASSFSVNRRSYEPQKVVANHEVALAATFYKPVKDKEIRTLLV